MLRFLLIDLFRRTKVVKNFYYFKNVMNNPYSILKDIQLKNLRDFLLELKTNTLFSKYLTEFSSDDISNNPQQILKNLPITDKRFITKKFNKIFCDKKGNYENNYTGGSTGSPFKYILDKTSISRVRAFNYYLWNKYIGYKFGDKILVIGGSSLVANNGLKTRIYTFLQNKIAIPGDIISISDVKKYIDIILSGNYKVIYGYPSAILTYIKTIRKLGLRFNKKIKGVITTSEMLFDKDKILLEDFFATKVINVYGANDGGIIAGSIDNENFIFNGLDCYVEEVRTVDNKRELVLTNLNSRVFPFVRYKVGDIGSIDDNSSLGAFVIKNIKGRTRDYFANKKGNMFHGSLINKILEDVPGIIKYQLVQDKNFNIIFYIQTSNRVSFEKVSEKVKKKLEILINDKSISITVEFQEVFALTANQKLKLVISDAI